MSSTFENSNIDTAPAPGVYAPRRSQRVTTDLTASDGDIWQEKLAVCEGASVTGEPQLLVRSYYRNQRTQERVWDEPPSGAGTVLHATADARQKAELQKQELHLTLEMIPPEEEQQEVEQDNKEENKKPKKKGFFGRILKKKKQKKQIETAKDINLQKAIALSMRAQYGLEDDPIIFYDVLGDGANLVGGSSSHHSNSQQEEDDIALAKALSMSEQANNNNNNNQNNSNAYYETDQLSEEEIFQRALQRSKMEAQTNNGGNGVASMPDHVLGTTSPEQPSKPMLITEKIDPNDELNQKLPALTLTDTDDDNQKKSSVTTTTPTKSVSQFDPYGNK